MLDVHSPVPITEGESLAFGVSTKHLFHFLVGLAVSSPVGLLRYLVLPLLGEPPTMAFVVVGGIGWAFAAVTLHHRPLAGVLWLGARYALRPRVVLYDRDHRVRYWRQKEGMRV